MKKNFKLVLALVLSIMMIVGNMAVLADDGDLAVNSTLTVSGLDAGDTVAYYQVLAWENADDTHNGGWVWGSGVEDPYTGTTTVATLTAGHDGDNTITGAIAGDLAGHLGTAMTSPAGTISNGTWTAEGVPAGLYMVIVTPATAGTMYNPIFVAANYYVNGETPDSANSWAVTSENSYADSAMAKKSSIPLDKKALGRLTTNDAPLNDTDPYSTDVGEIIDFEVTTKVPKYAANYTNPKFILKDHLSDGLLLCAVSGIKVYKQNTDGSAGDELSNSFYTITRTDDHNYRIEFKKEYLQGSDIPANGQKIVVKYSAEVTNEAVHVVNQDKNTVDLIFSTTPNDEKGAGLLRDETNHFTFSIDANLLGSEYGEDSSTEAIKVGLDKEGHPIMSEQSYSWNSGKKHAALAGATFELHKGGKLYKNDLYPNGVIVKSDATGRITIKGLDVGDYELVETAAPAGWIKLQNSVPVKIEAEIDTNVTVKDEVTNTEAGQNIPVKVTYITNELKSYKVTIGGASTTYTMVNSKAQTIKASKEEAKSSDKELINTKGVELPHTGGMGTTLFYVGGSILVLAAAILLITKRRMNSND